MKEKLRGRIWQAWKLDVRWEKLGDVVHVEGQNAGGMQMVDASENIVRLKIELK